jgi:hypothetical protein
VHRNAKKPIMGFRDLEKLQYIPKELVRLSHLLTSYKSTADNAFAIANLYIHIDLHSYTYPTDVYTVCARLYKAAM